MATGDIKGNTEALRIELTHIKYPHGLNTIRAEAGDPAELLPCLSYVILRFSRHVATLAEEYQLHGKTDQRFVESAWKFLRDKLDVKPALTPSQYLSEGYAERKLLLLRQIIKACKEHHTKAARKERLAALKGTSHTEQKVLHSAERHRPAHGTNKAKAKDESVTCAITLEEAEVNCSLFRNMLSDEEKHDCVVEVPGAAHRSVQDGNNASQSDDALPAHQKCSPVISCSPVIEQPRPLPANVLPHCKARVQSTRAVENVHSAVVGAELLTPRNAVHPPTCQPPRAMQEKACSVAPAAAIPGMFSWVPAAPSVQATAPHILQPAAPAGAVQQQSGQTIGGHLQGYEVQLHPKFGVEADQHVILREPLIASSLNHSLLQVVQELQVRLQLAEETALEARQTTEQVQESLQARIAVLEGRVKFLEGGFQLQPAMPLPWTSSGTDQHVYQQPGLSMRSGVPNGMGAPWMPPLQEGQPHQQLDHPANQHPGHLCRSLTLPTAAAHILPVSHAPVSPICHPQNPYVPVCLQSAPLSQHRPNLDGPTNPRKGGLKVPASTALAQNCTPLDAKSFSSTGELISSMQSRFSEAAEFLQTLR